MKNDHDSGVPTKALVEGLLNQGQVLCDLKFYKTADIKNTLEFALSLLMDHDYRFLNRSGQDLIETVYNKAKVPYFL